MNSSPRAGSTGPPDGRAGQASSDGQAAVDSINSSCHSSQVHWRGSSEPQSYRRRPDSRLTSGCRVTFSGRRACTTLYGRVGALLRRRLNSRRRTSWVIGGQRWCGCRVCQLGSTVTSCATEPRVTIARGGSTTNWCKCSRPRASGTSATR